MQLERQDTKGETGQNQNYGSGMNQGLLIKYRQVMILEKGLYIHIYIWPPNTFLFQKNPYSLVDFGESGASFLNMGA